MMVVNSILLIHNLEPLRFLDSGGALASMSNFNNLQKRSAYIQFVHFRCYMDRGIVDTRGVNFPHLTFSFCLKLIADIPPLIALGICVMLVAENFLIFMKQQYPLRVRDIAINPLYVVLLHQTRLLTFFISGGEK